MFIKPLGVTYTHIDLEAILTSHSLQGRRLLYELPRNSAVALQCNPGNDYRLCRYLQTFAKSSLNHTISLMEVGTHTDHTLTVTEHV